MVDASVSAKTSQTGSPRWFSRLRPLIEPGDQAPDVFLPDQDGVLYRLVLGELDTAGEREWASFGSFWWWRW